jgi:hypothetical protein
MTDAIAHRGPDVTVSSIRGWPGGTRPSAACVIDLSTAGNQPMPSETGDVLVVQRRDLQLPAAASSISKLAVIASARTPTQK